MAIFFSISHLGLNCNGLDKFSTPESSLLQILQIFLWSAFKMYNTRVPHGKVDFIYIDTVKAILGLISKF